MTTAKTIKVAIIEDRCEIREGLATLINFTGGFECTGKFGSMEEALSRIPHNLPDVVLSDIGLPGIDGIEGIRRLKVKFHNLTILMLSVYEDNERIFEALCAGAVGYLLKKNAARKIARIPARGGRGRRADVARSRAQSHHAFSRLSPARKS